MNKKRKLLLIGSNGVHLHNYIQLIDGFFDETEWLTNEVNADDPVHSVAMDFSVFKNPLKTRHTIKAVRKRILEFNPDVIHVHQANSYAWIALKASENLSVPVIVTAWGSDILLNPEKGIWMHKMVRYILKTATAFTCDSWFMANRMNVLLPERNLDIMIANYGISTQNIPVYDKEKIFYSNRLHKSLYRIDSIIDAFSLFLKNEQNRDWKLVIAATGELTDSLKQKVHNLQISDNVEFAGWVSSSQNIEFYSKASFFVSVPETDATSISLLEAMYYGAIPVVSNLPSNLEWVNDGINGCVVQNLNSDFLLPALSVNQKEARALNRKIIEAKGTKEVNRRLYLSLYERLFRQ